MLKYYLRQVGDNNTYHVFNYEDIHIATIANESTWCVAFQPGALEYDDVQYVLRTLNAFIKRDELKHQLEMHERFIRSHIRKWEVTMNN